MGDEKTEQVLDALRNTVAEVVGTMAWTDVQFAGMEETANFTLTNEVSGLIRLYGELGGMIGISLTRNLASEVVARIVGLPASDIQHEDLLDGVAELANMICGGVKTKIGVGNVELSPPVSIVGNDYTAQWKTDRPTIILTFQLDDDLLQVYACI